MGVGFKHRRFFLFSVLHKTEPLPAKDLKPLQLFSVSLLPRLNHQNGQENNLRLG